MNLLDLRSQLWDAVKALADYLRALFGKKENFTV